MTGNLFSSWRKPASALAAALVAVGVALGAAPAASSAEDAAPLLKSTDPGAARFTAVGRLNGSASCTATVFGQDGPKRPNAKALVLTNGHCVGRFGSNDVLVNQDVTDRGWTFIPAYFIDTAAKHTSFAATRVHYATMKGTDLAVVELAATYADLAKVGVEPLRLTATQPAGGVPVELVHAPAVGIPEQERYLRYSRCHSGVSTDVAEGHWLWNRFQPNDCRGISGGSSGSPIVRAGDNRIISVLNTVVEPEFSGDCGDGRPCAIGPDGVRTTEGTAYAGPVGPMLGCLRDGPVFDLSKSGCVLDPGQKLNAIQWPTATRSTITQPDGTVVPARWNATLTANGMTHARVKTGPLGRTDCGDPQGYGPVFAIADRPVYNEVLPPREGFVLLCAVAGTDAGWQPYRHATKQTVKVDDTPPTIPLTIAAEDLDEHYRIAVRYRNGEIDYHRLKYGPVDQTNCEDPAGYRPPLPFGDYLEKAHGPWRVCAIGYDAAGNHTRTYVSDLS